MRKDILLPGLALAGGVLGFGLRLLQWSWAYDPGTQLFQSSPVTLALLALTALLALLFLTPGKAAHTPDDYLPAFRCPSSLHMALMAAAAFLFFGAGVLGLLEGLEQLNLWRMGAGSPMVTYPAALLLGAVLCFPAGLAVLLLGKAAYRGEVSTATSLLASFPPFAGLVWLFATHLAHGTDPVLMRYGFLLGAAALLTLAHYDVAGWFFGHCCPRRTVFCALTGVVLALTSLADGPTRATALLTAAFSLSALAQSQALLRNLYGPAWPRRLREERMPSGAEDTMNEDAPTTKTHLDEGV